MPEIDNYKDLKNKYLGKRILVIGDLMVDEYITGEVRRISPEAPVPVLNFAKKTREAGGAANVAKNLASLGAKVYIGGICAKDEAGLWLREHLCKSDISTDCIFEEENRPTILKTRFATNGQQLLRMDDEKTDCIILKSQLAILNFLKRKIKDIDGVLLSDYRKGVLLDEMFIKNIISYCNKNNVIVSVDSKSKKIECFAGCTFVKPNNFELEEAVGVKIVDDESFNNAGKQYLFRSSANALVVTRGAKGISIFRADEKRKDFEAKAQQIYDVTGAGDTVISIITLSLAAGFSLEDSVKLSNYGASVVISKVGTYSLNADELVGRINEDKD